MSDRILQGQAAERLLLDETFGDACRATDAWYREAVFKTKPGEADKREELFAEYSGFRRVLERLHAWKADGLKAADEAGRAIPAALPHRRRGPGVRVPKQASEQDVGGVVVDLHA